MSKSCPPPDIPQISQRDLLDFLSYDLGMPTPQAILDEIYHALPTLRHLLDFERAWEDVLSETWKQLLAAARCMRYLD
jgi:ABC-type uncharacterized transport system fused permease/ATPase subunit